MKTDAVYGPRADRHQRIMFMTEEELHREHPFTEELTFNTGKFMEIDIPTQGIILG